MAAQAGWARPAQTVEEAVAVAVADQTGPQAQQAHKGTAVLVERAVLVLLGFWCWCIEESPLKKSSRHQAAGPARLALRKLLFTAGLAQAVEAAEAKADLAARTPRRVVVVVVLGVTVVVARKPHRFLRRWCQAQRTQLLSEQAEQAAQALLLLFLSLFQPAQAACRSWCLWLFLVSAEAEARRYLERMGQTLLLLTLLV